MTKQQKAQAIKHFKEQRELKKRTIKLLQQEYEAYIAHAKSK